MTGRTVYISRDGAIVRREGERLRVFARREHVTDLPVHDVAQLVVIGNVTLTPAALDLLVRRGIDAVLLSHHGRYRARFVSGISGNVRLRLAQYGALTDATRTLSLARCLVAGKIANQRALLQRHARRHGSTHGLRVAVKSMKAARIRADLVDTLDAVRGCEGSASAAYFRAFPELVRATGFRFDGRNRRPPLDPVNALLSLGYTLLSNVVEAAVRVVGLDPYLGALHAPEAGRPSLVCDLVEELRAPVVDALVVAALNQQAFKPDDFDQPLPDEPVVLPPETLRWFVTLFERRMSRTTLYQPLGKCLSWRHVAEQQARAFARHLLGGEDYVPYRMR